MTVISKKCVEVEPNTWQCDQGVAPSTGEGSVTATLSGQPPSILSYNYVYDPPGCHYCGQHSGQGLYDWAGCPWGQTIWRFHCVACNYYSGYDRILYDCGTPVREAEPTFDLTTIGPDGVLAPVKE